MSITRPIGEQLTFKSAKTGDHILDTYLESVERGTRTLSELMDELVDSSGDLRTDIFEFRETPIVNGVRLPDSKSSSGDCPKCSRDC